MPKVIFLMGPTASGKSDLALQLVERLPVEIISVDSAMIYRGMDIGTAKPDAATLARVPHHLVDICDPSERYSVAQFCTAARGLIDDIIRRGKTPLLVGGTMMYFHALRYGLSELPEADPVVRAAIAAEAESRGWAALHAELAERDPAAAARIHVNDPQRIGRALEISRIANASMSSLQQQRVAALAYPIVPLAIAPRERSVLHERIAQRFQQMLAAGFLQEMTALYQRGDLTPDLPSMRCVGYRQFWQYLAGECSYEEAVTKSIVASRQLAKRQLTWLRSAEGVQWLETDAQGLLEKSVTLIGCHPAA